MCVCACVPQEVRDKYTAVVKMIDSGDKLKLDQNHVETVIPAPGEREHATLHTTSVFFQGQLKVNSAGPPNVSAGKRVLILNGPHRDTEALLEGIDEKNFSATLTLDSVSWLSHMHTTRWLFWQQFSLNSTSKKAGFKKAKKQRCHPSLLLILGAWNKHY